MRKLAFLMMLTAAGIVNAQVVPNSAAGTEGDGTFSLTSTAAAGRTFQMTIAANQLTAFNGLSITGMTFRLNGPGTAAWPPVAANFADWEIYMGPGVAPSAMSNTFASNFTGGVTQVRDGPLSFNPGDFSFGSTPNAFGPMIAFDTGYLYTGGDLTIEMRFTQQTGATTQSPFDAVLASGGPANGWGVDFAGRWTGNFAGTTGANGNFLVTQFQAIPEPASLSLLALGSVLLMGRRRA
jgi:hypothetical protein